MKAVTIGNAILSRKCPIGNIICGILLIGVDCLPFQLTDPACDNRYYTGFTR